MPTVWASVGNDRETLSDYALMQMNRTTRYVLALITASGCATKANGSAVDPRDPAGFTPAELKIDRSEWRKDEVPTFEPEPTPPPAAETVLDLSEPASHESPLAPEPVTTRDPRPSITPDAPTEPDPDGYHLEDGIPIANRSGPAWCAKNGWCQPKPGVGRCKKERCTRTSAFACFMAKDITSGNASTDCFSSYAQCESVRDITLEALSKSIKVTSDCIIFRETKEK